VDLQVFGPSLAPLPPAYYNKMRNMGCVLHEKTGATAHDILQGQQKEVVGSHGLFGGIVVDEYEGL
jgi:hypothetical protein